MQSWQCDVGDTNIECGDNVALRIEDMYMIYSERVSLVAARSLISDLTVPDHQTRHVTGRLPIDLLL